MVVNCGNAADVNLGVRMGIRSERASAAILRALGEAGRPLGATQIAGMVLSMGVELQARTIRYHLQRLDEQGLTRLVSRRLGRELTELGREEASGANLTEHLGIVAGKIDELAYRMSFDVHSGEGTVIVNTSCIDPADLGRSLKEVGLVVGCGFAVSKRLVIADAGSKVGSMVVPDGMVGIGTVCSITLNGILQKAGIPVTSRFGGLLEIRKRQAVRFLNMIEYGGSTLDPLDVFMRAGMTRVRDVVLRGSGVICASFREVPAAAAPDITRLRNAAEGQGITGILAVGRPSQPLLGVPVSEGHCGLVVSGGLNSIAAVRELGVRATAQSLAGLAEYGDFISVYEAKRRMAR